MLDQHIRSLQCRESVTLTLGVKHFFEFLPYLKKENFFGRYLNLFTSFRISRLFRFSHFQPKVAKTPYLDLISFSVCVFVSSPTFSASLSISTDFVIHPP